MTTLIVGVGALGGLMAARMLAAGAEVALATRTRESARELQLKGLQVAGEAPVQPLEVAALETYLPREFELIVLATKAHDALQIAPHLRAATLLPIQNGGVSQILSERLGACVLGGLSNLAATMVRPGVYEQKNQGHLLIGELDGSVTPRAQAVRDWLSQAVEVRLTDNLSGAVWSKLLINCSVTTLGALGGCTMSDYIHQSRARLLFDQVYAEALAVALASGARPQKMLVDPLGSGEQWLQTVLEAYGDLKPSMLQDFERGRTTEIDFLNGYVVDLGQRLGVPVPRNAAVVAMVHRITRGELLPGLELLQD